MTGQHDSPTSPRPVPGTGPRPVPSGTQFPIAHGNQRATVVEVGAAIREYVVGDRAVFQSFAEHEVSWAYHGSVLVPWPNRVRDGRYEFDGEKYQLALSEPARLTALHGLAAWQRWELLDQSASSVTLQFRLLPSPGYPFHLDTVVRYALGDDGLAVTTTSTNVGARACPYAIGFHPYVWSGAAAPTGDDAPLDACTLQLDAGRRFVPDERLIPIGADDVEGTVYDFRTSRSLAGVRLDDGFTDVIADAEGRSSAWVAGIDGRSVQVWADSTFGFWQIFSGDTLPADIARRSLAVEPMTAAPNAFESGEGLLRLLPGESVTTQWGARLH
jgi:aldose 1-epimerase